MTFCLYPYSLTPIIQILVIFSLSLFFGGLAKVEPWNLNQNWELSFFTFSNLFWHSFKKKNKIKIGFKTWSKDFETLKQLEKSWKNLLTVPQPLPMDWFWHFFSNFLWKGRYVTNKVVLFLGNVEKFFGTPVN